MASHSQAAREGLNVNNNVHTLTKKKALTRIPVQNITNTTRIQERETLCQKR